MNRRSEVNKGRRKRFPVVSRVAGLIGPEIDGVVPSRIAGSVPAPSITAAKCLFDGEGPVRIPQPELISGGIATSGARRERDDIADKPAAGAGHGGCGASRRVGGELGCPARG